MQTKVLKPLRLIKYGVLAIALGLSLAGGCTVPPDGYQGAGRIQMLPGLVTDATTLVPDGSEGGSSLMGALCAPGGVICHKDTDCCMGPCTGSASAAGYCSANANSGTGVCAPDGVICEVHSDCCANFCSIQGVCGDLPSNVCIPDGVLCGSTQECCSPCSDGGSTPCNRCESKSNGPACNGYVSHATAPLCVPLGVLCTPGANANCCAGDCIENESFETVCIVPSP
jgi:hypothetical protein